MVHNSAPQPRGEYDKPEHVKRLLEQVLMTGKENSLACATLARRYHINTDPKHCNIRQAALMLLEEGQPVIGGPKGYFKARTKQELLDKVKSLRVQIQGLLRTERLVWGLAEKWGLKPAQQSMFGD